jgi:CRP-like cAMP-binding protein
LCCFALGTCEISISGECLGRVDSGSSFGDLALMYNCPRAATITAKTYGTLWTLDRVFFRQAMVTSSSNQNVQLSQFLSKIVLFASLGQQQLNQLARSLTKQSYDSGHYIIKQGDFSDQFYVIFKGAVTVSRTDDSGNENIVAELREGEVFGERALIKKEPRKANIIANGPVECYYLESQDFYSMLGEFVEKFNKMNELRIIRSAKVLSQIVSNDFRLQEFVAQFTSHRMFSGQRLVCGIGEIFIVIDGVFQGSNGERYSADGLVQVGGFEKTADEAAGALTALTDEAFLFSFTKDQLIETVSKCEEDQQRKQRRTSFLGATERKRSDSSIGDGSSTKDGLSAGGAEKEIVVAAQRRKETAMARRLSLADFSCQSLADLDVITALGKGTFGSVYLCEHRLTGRKMALKCLDKKAIVSSGQHIYVQREVIALQNFQHPFLSEYFGVILSRQKVCFLLEFIPGGELWTYLYDEKFITSGERMVGEYGGIPAQQATMYAANVILALEHMHDLGYTYRDLKPENLMISYNGYLKLVDFGFAKQVPFFNKSGQVQYRTFTLCGTPDYMAP